jgi:hypothetical protein
MAQSHIPTPRRTWLKQAVSLSTLAALGRARLGGLTGSFGLLAVPKASQAAVVESLAIASAVCSLIGSRKKSDGGIGAMLTASIEYQRVMAQQLQELQLGMAEVLSKVNALPSKIRSLLYEERLKSLQAEIGGSIDQYDHEVRAAAVSYQSYQAWQQNPQAIRRMGAISSRIDEAISNLSYNGWTDAVTSLYLPPALFASLGAMAFLGESIERMKAEAQRYLDLMQRAQDSTQPSSIGAALVDRQASFGRIVASLQALGVRLPPAEQTNPAELVLGELRVQHHVPAVSEVVRCRTVLPGHGGGKHRPEGGSGDDPPVCTVTQRAAPEQVGETSGFRFVLSLTSQWVTDARLADNAFGVRQFSLDKWDVVATSSADAPLLRTPAPSAEARLAAAKSSAAARVAEDKATKVKALVQSLNEDMAFLALNAGAMASLQAARSDAFAFFGLEV